MKNQTLWVLTREINDHNQDGEYFVAAWRERPDHHQLHAAGVPFKIMNWVENGGGRKKYEEEWFYLVEVVEGAH